MDVLEDIISDMKREMDIIVSYAWIYVIFIYIKEYFNIPFLLLNWFISLEINDLKLNCSHYKLQWLSDQIWRRIYAVKWIDHQSNVHFVHQYQKTYYSNINHDETNVYYLYNIFYYIAV